MSSYAAGGNSAIHLKDQVHYPTAGDLRTALMTLPRVFFGLTGDVKRAHRLVKVAADDWGHTACQTGVQGQDVLRLNTAGAFGVSSSLVSADEWIGQSCVLSDRVWNSTLSGVRRILPIASTTSRGKSTST